MHLMSWMTSTQTRGSSAGRTQSRQRGTFPWSTLRTASACRPRLEDSIQIAVSVWDRRVIGRFGAVVSEPALIALLYRADWTQLSLSAEVAWAGGDAPHFRSAAPGAPGWVGPPPWAEPGGPREDPGPCAGPQPPFPELLCPSWLLSGFELVLGGTAMEAGREALRLVARPRAGSRQEHAGTVAVLDRVEAIVDTELGILLRCERVLRGQAPRVEELHEVMLDPPGAADETQFAPPPGSTVSESPGALFTGPGWRAAKTAAGLGAAGLGFAFRHAPRRPPQPPADEEAAMPHDERDAHNAGQPGHGQPVSDELLYLLYRSGAAAGDFAAEMHQWRDSRGLVEQARSAGESAGIPGLGPGVVAETLAGQLPTTHRVASIRVAAPDRYRIDYLSGGPGHKPKTIACDGQGRWRAYDDKVAVGPAAPLPREITDLTDPSWLLQCRLSGGTPVTVRGRRGFRISAAPNPGGTVARTLMGLFAAEAVADAELGILLRLTSYATDRPAIRFELRDITRPATQAPADFRIDAPGVATVEDSGNPLDEVDMPELIKRAVKAAHDAARHASAGVTAVTSFLDAVRGKNP